MAVLITFVKKKKIVAEIKNKHNSTNFTSLAGSFDKLRYILSKKKYSTFTGYLVRIIPKKPNNFSKKLVITENKNKSEYRKPLEKIQEINGEFFYEKITGKKNVLKSIFHRLPGIIKTIDINKTTIVDQIFKDKKFDYYLNKALKD